MIGPFNEGRWRPLDRETPAEYVRRLTAIGDMPNEIVKGLRNSYRLSLGEARNLVVTPAEISIFLKAHLARGVSAYGASRLLKRVFGMTRQDAVHAVENSGLWSGSNN